MLHVVLPISGRRKLPFFLAAEEWIARNLPQDEYFLPWQVAPTVICGRNQDVPSEVNLEFCRNNGIEVYRRKSGGGAVFADMNNIMFSYIAPETAVHTAFEGYTSKVCRALRELGLDAHASGRNDILIGDRKVAGNAYWQCGGRSIVHGTMLYDTDTRLMNGALTPSRAKLESNKVVSVQSRVTTIHSHLPGISIEAFMSHMLSSMCDAGITLPDTALAGINGIEQPYYDERFVLEGRRGPVRRYDGAGSVGVDVDVADGAIVQVCLYGDFLTLRDLETALKTLKGKRAEHAEILETLGSARIIAGMTNDRLARLIADAATTQK